MVWRAEIGVKSEVWFLLGAERRGRGVRAGAAGVCPFFWAWAKAEQDFWVSTTGRGRRPSRTYAKGVICRCVGVKSAEEEGGGKRRGGGEEGGEEIKDVTPTRATP